MKQADYNRLEAMIGRAYTLAAQVLNGDEPDSTLAEEISGECAELLALMDGGMDVQDLADPELLALARALQPKEK
jgi:ABC-type histidine transport system ATPase subunit